MQSNIYFIRVRILIRQMFLMFMRPTKLQILQIVLNVGL